MGLSFIVQTRTAFGQVSRRCGPAIDKLSMDAGDSPTRGLPVPEESRDGPDLADRRPIQIKRLPTSGRGDRGSSDPYFGRLSGGRVRLQDQEARANGLLGFQHTEQSTALL